MPCSHRSYNFALTHDGAVLEWGRGRPAPEPIVSGLSGGVAVADYTVLKEDGTVWTWAREGPLLQQPPPVNRLDGVVAISSRIALKSDGTVWGISNPPVRMPRLGGVIDIATGGPGYLLTTSRDGSVSEFWLGAIPLEWGGPVQVGGFDSVVRVAKGPSTLGCPWVSLGDGYSLCRSEPIPTAHWQELALKADGTVWAWDKVQQI